MARRELGRLHYAMEPIFNTEFRRPLAERMIGYELLYRVPCAHFPDRALFEALARNALGTTLHINVRSDSVLTFDEVLVGEAAAANGLVLEWVEQADERSQRRIQEVADQLSMWRDRYGVKIAIDDWGNGLCGMARFLALEQPPEIVKFDGKLFHRILAGNDTALSFTRHIIDALPKEVTKIMEWVEQEGHLDLAVRMGVDAVQGRLYSGDTRALSLDDVEPIYGDRPRRCAGT